MFQIKDNGSKEVIIEIGMAVVAVALLIVFRSQISQLVASLMTKVTQVISQIFNDSIANGSNFSTGNMTIG